MNSVNSALSPFLQTYTKWLLRRPQLIADIENSVRWLSYYASGRFINSALALELIYSMPNLLILLNDRLIYSSKYARLKLPQFQSKIKVWLTVIEYTEALIELSAKNLWGERGRWTIVLVIQILKAILRLILVYRNKERITQHPAIPPLDREKLGDCFNAQPAKEGFVLKRSGTIVRKVTGTEPYRLRVWGPVIDMDVINADQLPNPRTARNMILAETLDIIKPLVHLGCLSARGRKNWMPWSVSFIMDLLSLHLFSQEAKNARFTREEKVELYRRRISLLLYIVRSPCYEKISRQIFLSLLNRISRNVPLARFVADPVAKHLPHWENTYFYMWSS